VRTWSSLPTSSTKRGVEGRVRSLGIKLGRGTRLSRSNLHRKPTTRGLVSIREHPWVLGQATGTFTHKTHHGPDWGEATTFPDIVYSVALCQGYIQVALFPGTPKLESRNCPGTLDVRSSSPRTRIGMRFEPKLYLSSRAFQRHVALLEATSGRGRFPTFSGRESNCQFDSRPFFCP